MTHDFSIVFETENPLWKRVLEIFEKNEKYEKKIIKNRNLHHKFPRSFSKIFGEPIDNDKDNLISLTPSDHFLVHYYYYKLAKKGYRASMALAFRLMARDKMKTISPETAEAIAKDFEIAKNEYKPTEETLKKISEKLKGKPKPKVSKALLGKHHSEETKKKMSVSAKKAATPELCQLRSETQKGKPHPHKSGRKGLPISEFGKLFYDHYGFTSSGHTVLYRQELHFWKEHDKHCSWELEELNK